MAISFDSNIEPHHSNKQIKTWMKIIENAINSTQLTYTK